MKQCLQDIFSFRNLMTHIVCRHYVHMTHIKFFLRNWSNDKYGSRPYFSYLFKQIPIKLYIVMCSSFRLQNITLFQGLSCLWRHNSARMIISLAWFHSYFHRICATLGAIGSTDCSEIIHSTDSLGANLYFSPLFIEILHALGVVIWIHDSCCSLRTTIQAEKYQQLKFIIFDCLVFSFENIWVEMEKIFSSFGEKISTFYASHP